MVMVERKIQKNKLIVDNALKSFLIPEKIGESNLSEALKYCVLGGGKRIRAFLVREFAQMYGGSDEAALQFALAVELGHAASLIHDDMPCMDNSDIRHGRESCHVRYGEAEALLAGDALLILSFELVNDISKIDAEVIRYAVKVLSQNAGVKGLCYGQEQDLAKSCNNLEELYALYDLKTGSPIYVASVFGYLSSNKIPEEKELERISRYAKMVGRIFQVKDDLLDATKTNAEIGKSSGIDMRNGTKTILTYMSVQEANEKMRFWAEKAAQIFNNPILMALPFYLAEREK